MTVGLLTHVRTLCCVLARPHVLVSLLPCPAQVPTRGNTEGRKQRSPTWAPEAFPVPIVLSAQTTCTRRCPRTTRRCTTWVSVQQLARACVRVPPAARAWPSLVHPSCLLVACRLPACQASRDRRPSRLHAQASRCCRTSA